MKSLTTLLIFFTMTIATAQDQLPYYEIPEAPISYEPGNIMARMMDGLGYRYYWASESLTETDLNYKPSEEARSTRETLDHICGLTNFVLKTIDPSGVSGANYKSMTYEEVRALTLKNIEKASKLLKGKSAEDLAKIEIILGSGDKKSTMPFWNVINGPVEDAVYHTGQVTSFRRSSGNPMNPKVSVLRGKNRS